MALLSILVSGCQAAFQNYLTTPCGGVSSIHGQRLLRRASSCGNENHVRHRNRGKEAHRGVLRGAQSSDPPPVHPRRAGRVHPAHSRSCENSGDLRPLATLQSGGCRGNRRGRLPASRGRMYHFVGKTLRDGRPVPKDGEWLEHTGKLELCVSGLHASPTPWEALQYAPGPILCEVELKKIIKDDDKVVARKRKIIRRADLTEVCRLFVRKQALSVIHLWDASPVVEEYLETGKEELRAHAREAAGDAAVAEWTPARAAAWAGTWDGAWAGA